MGVLIDCKVVADQILTEARNEVEEIIKNTGGVPRLAVIIVGDDPASQVFFV